MPAPAQKKPLKPKAPTAPKGPSAKSKTGNAACSSAASNWQLAIRGKASINPDTYQTLAKCRAMTRTSKNAEGRARAGYNLSDQGANAIKGRLQSRFDRDLITQKSRDAKVKELLAGRKEKQAAPAAKPVAAPAPAPAPARYSLGGQLAPGRGKDSPEYGTRAITVYDRAKKRADEINSNYVNNEYGGGSRADKMLDRENELRKVTKKLSKPTQKLRSDRFEKAKSAPAPAPAPATFQPKTVHVFDTYQHGSGEMKRGYVAKITGTHPKYNLERQFLNGPNDRGTKTVTIKERGIYEMQSKDLNKPGSTERTYELHGRNKVRTIHESLNPRTHHVPIEDNKSIGRVARLLTLFGKKKAAAPAPPQAAPMAAKPAASSGTTLKPVKKKGDTSQQITKASISSTTSKGSDFLTPVTEQRHQMLSVRNTVTKIKAKDRARAESQSGVQTLKTSQLTADPNQFQYKMNTAGPVGVTDQFKETRVWNKELAGVVQVWKSPTENKTFVVNGHHRYELAQRLGVSKLNVQYIQAQSPAEARMKGALTNIAEGRGTSVDAAKFFRDQPNVQDWSKELKAKGISLSERTASEGLALKDVHPKIWRDVVNEMTPLSRAVSIGKSGLKQEDQLNIYNRSTAGNWTSGKTSEFATELKNSARTKVKSGSLFGDDEEVSVFEHRAALSDRLKNRLSSDKSLFSKVARGRNASRIESVGSNKIDKESSATRASEADNALMAFDRERKYSGRVNNELNNFGQRIAKGEKIDKIYNDFEKRMTQTLRLMNSGKFDRRAARLKAIAK